MTPPPRSRPHGRQLDGHGEQPTQPLRPVSGQQPYGPRRLPAQQPPYGRHSGGRRDTTGGRRRRGDHTAVITGIIAVTALLVAGAGAWMMTGGKDDNSAPEPTTQSPASVPATGKAPGAAGDAEVGDCIKIVDANAADTDLETIDCADPAAVYRVGVRQENGAAGCPGANYVSYTEKNRLLLCLTLNAHEGDCFHETERQDARVPCESPDASYRVGEIVEGTEDASRCGGADAENAITYPEPPLTICRLTIE